MFDFSKVRLLSLLFCLLVSVLVCNFSYHHLSHSNDGLKADIQSTGQASTLLFPVKPLVIWCVDYHIGPIADLKDMLQPLGVHIIFHQLGGYFCKVSEHKHYCEANKLRVINTGNGVNLRDPSLILRFYEEYKNDTEMQSVDAFVCFNAAALCELYEPFNKSIMVITAHRYEYGRHDSIERWTKWNENLQRWSKNPRNVIAANNPYDAEYIRYFTGIRPLLLYGFNGYVKDKYSPHKPGFLLGHFPARAYGKFKAVFENLYAESCRKIRCTIELTSLRSLFGQNYKYSDIITHRGIVHAPYQTYTISILEQYRMNIPLFFPTLELLTDWHYKHLGCNRILLREFRGGIFEVTIPANIAVISLPSGIKAVSDKTLLSDMTFIRSTESLIPAHPTQIHRPDPNNDVDSESIRYWLAFSYYYQLPYIRYYNSTDELAQLLQTVTQAELDWTSKRMKKYNDKFRTSMVEKWKTVLRRIAQYSTNAPH